MYGFNLASLGLLTLAVTNTMAVQVKFMRFSQPACDTNFHIAKDTYLHNPHCMTFDEHEPPFESFMADPEDDISDVTNKQCEILVYEQKNCKGNAYTMSGRSLHLPSPISLTCADLFTDLQMSQNVCGNPSTSSNYKINGRSVKVMCKDRPTSITTMPPTSTLSTVPSSSASAMTAVVQAADPVSSSASKQMTTVTLYPKPSGCGECSN